MKIRLYNEARGAGALGGGETTLAVLADALSHSGHSVEILHHRPGLTAEKLAQFADVDLSRVAVSFMTIPPTIRGHFWRAIQRYRDERDAEADWSGQCDAFIACVHETVPCCAASIGALIVLFPFFDPDHLGNGQRGFLGKALQRRWHKWKLSRRLASYKIKTANSKYTAKWAKHRWGADCAVLYPPVDLAIEQGPKVSQILSVGRFAAGRHRKNQVEILDAFGALPPVTTERWSYYTVGACGAPAETAFLQEVQTCAAKVGATVIANPDRATLVQLYRESKIFWHAAGMKSDESTHPELAEHFGMTTVEAMSAGCVPVVVNKGGQQEIVEHGVSGFLWNNTDELKEYTNRLMTDEALWGKMSHAASQRAQHFSRDAFLTRFAELMSPYAKLSFPETANPVSNR